MLPDKGSRMLRPPSHPRTTLLGVLRGRPLVTAFAIAAAVAVTWGIGGAACGPSDEPLPPRADRPPVDIDAGDDDASTGGPCLEGATRRCKVVIGQQGDVTTCVEGFRTCRNGVWSECEGTLTETTNATPPKDDDPECPPPLPLQKSQRAAALSEPELCKSNPCDPSCRYFEESPTGGVVLQPHISGYYDEGTLEDAIAHSPQGFIDKGLKTPCSTTLDCQFDFHCVNKRCQPWAAGETIPGCTKPDLTTGFACTKNGKPTIPVCNRGNATAPAGVTIYIFPGNSPQFPTCVPDNQPYTCHTTEAVEPGACINVVGCPGLTGKGNKTIMVNPPRSPPQGPQNTAWIDECTCEDNWGDWSGSDTYCVQKPNYDTEPLAYAQLYEGECPEGSHVQWGYMTYESITPSDSYISIQGHTAPSLTDLPVAPLVTLGTAKALPPPNMQSCTLTGPAGCPLDLYDAFDGPPDATNSFFEIVFTLNPSLTKAEAPTLSRWNVFYSCPWSE